MSHAWRQDSLARDTHARVRALSNELKKLGWSVWLDEEQLRVGVSIDRLLCKGINDSQVVIACLTPAYVEKVDSQLPQDACAKEFNFAHMSNKPVLPVVMDPCMLSPSAWGFGVTRMRIGGTIFFDATSNDMHSVAKRLSRALRLFGLAPNPRHARRAMWQFPSRRIAGVSRIRVRV